jgi:glutathione S-transferase
VRICKVAEEAYDKAAEAAAARLDECEKLLDDRKYIAGDTFSWRIADRLNQR